MPWDRHYEKKEGRELFICGLKRHSTERFCKIDNVQFAILFSCDMRLVTVEELFELRAHEPGNGTAATSGDDEDILIASTVTKEGAD